MAINFVPGKDYCEFEGVEIIKQPRIPKALFHLHAKLSTVDVPDGDRRAGAERSEGCALLHHSLVCPVPLTARSLRFDLDSLFEPGRKRENMPSKSIMRVLIVDDEQDMRQSLGMLIEGHFGFEVISAGTATEALEFLLADNQPNVDLILTDVSMPGMNGIDFCSRLKSSSNFQDIPVLVITGRATENVLQSAFEAGAHDFIVKGSSSIELLARVRSASNLKRVLDQRRAREIELIELTQKLEQANEKLHRFSMIDELTKIPNRRFFNLLLKREWLRSRRDGHPLSILMIDVDSFKSFNDRYGHLAGDRCLKVIASTLSGLIRRPGDTVARFGGEEFVVLLPNTGLSGASNVAETLRSGVAALNLEHTDSSYRRVTVSLGVAASSWKPNSSPESVLNAADEALYRAKAGGRNRTVLDKPTPIEARSEVPVPNCDESE